MQAIFVLPSSYSLTTETARRKLYDQIVPLGEKIHQVSLPEGIFGLGDRTDLACFIGYVQQIITKEIEPEDFAVYFFVQNEQVSQTPLLLKGIKNALSKQIKQYNVVTAVEVHGVVKASVFEVLRQQQDWGLAEKVKEFSVFPCVEVY